MRTFSMDPTCYLIELADLEQDPLHDIVSHNLQPVTQTFDWAKDYLCNPHDELGREGPVCPFVPYSLASGLFFITLQRGRTLTRSDVFDTIMKYRDWFLEIEPREGKRSHYKAILVLFPDIPAEDAPQIIDTTQADLKPEFVAKGLMIGQFHQVPPQDSGLWNPDFRPLKSPVPLLAIRHMVPSDFPFLTKDRRFVTSYLEIYGNTIPKKQKEHVREVTLRYGIDMDSYELE